MDGRGRELAFTSNAGKIRAVAQDLRPLENVQVSVFLTNTMHSFVYLRRERGLVRELCQHTQHHRDLVSSGAYTLHLSIFEKWEQKKNFFIRNLLIS